MDLDSEHIRNNSQTYINRRQGENVFGLKLIDKFIKEKEKRRFWIF